ncbi:unnamed protein product, partial [Closterium sp. NIES-53]
MASLCVFAFDHEGRPIQFDTWLEDLQMYLLSDSRDSVSLFDHTSGAAPAPPATANTQALYNAVVARYSSPATAALGRLLLPYLFPELSAFATVEDLVSHLRTSDARYRAAAPAEFLDKNQPPMFINLYSIVTSLPDSLRSGCSTSPLAPSYASTAAVDVLGAEDVGAASDSEKRRSIKGKGSRGGGGGSGGGGGAALEVVEAVEVVAVVGVVAGVGALAAAVEAAVGVALVAAVGVVAVGLELLSVEVLAVARGSGSSIGARPRRPSSFVSGFLSVGRLGVVVATQFGDEAERPRWAELLRSGVAIFDLEYDAIIAAMYALFVSAEGDCYLCVPPDPGIEVAALEASEFALSGTVPAKALHTVTLES